jgi:FtsP/CotA-like multicopper oxidase with cupredoxin domain
VTGISTTTPLAEINVKSGLKHRMRIVNMGCFECPFHLQVEGHRLSVIAVDGFPVKPVTVDTIIFLPGIVNKLEPRRAEDFKIVHNHNSVYCL